MAAAPAAGESDRIATDRPSISTSASTVPPGAVQIESGAAYAHTSVGGSPAERAFTLDLTLRVGVTERLELRLDGQPLVVALGAHEQVDNGDFALQVKWRLLDSQEGRWWPALAVLPFVNLPISSSAHGVNIPSFGIVGIASFSLPWKLGLDANAGVGAIAQRPSGYRAQGAVSVALSRELGERWSTYGEVFFASETERGLRDGVGFDAGVQFFVTQYLALDAAGQTSLTGTGPDYAFRAGLSVRFGR